ncbi:hypothetical protein [Butyrivibrio sp. YAB3001]|uniref:hypothetical protein n=1 Tax=Butyrivibrio sp. YAB3001 TaxID=1520812 RepID=UPI0008F6437E|nr:hypothetical protein [Butyrivibrio sp. YAB3001]SFC80421.1 hypothetical protein SAMN02910398_03185 [Butyrivibrio sp. YAB3001]
MLKKQIRIDQKTSLLISFVLIILLETLHVRDVRTIWNQNDEFGVWQGAAWILNLNWKEVVSENGFYGFGYGYLLAPLVNLFGHNSSVLTQVALCFQAIMHASCLFLSYYCISIIFPDVEDYKKIIVAFVSVISVTDLFYVYFFFAESLLRFVFWAFSALTLSWFNERKWYKVFLINAISIYAFSVHQRCILLLVMAVFLSAYAVLICIIRKEINFIEITKIVVTCLASVIFYYLAYKLPLSIYKGTMYAAVESGKKMGNLLSDRGYTLEFLIKGILLNISKEIIALQNIGGMIYYIGAIDCGLFFWGFAYIWKNRKRIKLFNPDKWGGLFYIFTTTIGGICLPTYQFANKTVYKRVEFMHYGRYCSYLFAPMLMLGVMYLLTEKNTQKILRAYIFIMVIFIIGGLSTFNVLHDHKVKKLFAFRNACPGVISQYFETSPWEATLYHTQVGLLCISLVFWLIFISKNISKFSKQIEIITFSIVVIISVSIANKESMELYEKQRNYVEQTYDIQKVLNDVDEFIVYNGFKYGSGLLQYNNMFSRIYLKDTIEEFSDDDRGKLVISLNNDENMKDIKNHSIVYENDRYVVWQY